MFARRPPRRRQCTSGQDLMMQRIPPSSTTPQRHPRLAEATDTASSARQARRSVGGPTPAEVGRLRGFQQMAWPTAANRAPRRVQSANSRGLTTQQIPTSSTTHCRPDHSRGWTLQRISSRSTVHVSQEQSELHGPLQAQHQSRLDDATDSNKFHGPCLQQAPAKLCNVLGRFQ